MRNRYLLLADVLLIAVAAFGSFALRFQLDFVKFHAEFEPFLFAALLVKPTVFLSFRLYARYWFYASVQDATALTVAVSFSSMVLAVLVGAALVLDLVPEFSRSVLLIDWMLTLVLVASVRLSLRVISDTHQRAQKAPAAGRRKRVLIVGAGEAGALVVREVRKNPQLGIVPIGFLDDDLTKVGKRVHGVTVLGPLSSLASMASSRDVDEIIVAMPTVSGTVMRAVAEQCQQLGVTSRTMPGVFELLDGHVSISRLRQVEIADLLRRDQVVSKPERPAYLSGRVVLVTGGGGSLGSELSRQVAHTSPGHLVLLGHGENSIFDAVAQLQHQFPRARVTPVIADIRNERRIADVFRQFRPDVVLHAAAHKHVPLMEGNPQEAVTNNVFGSVNVVNEAVAAGAARFVLISTDKAVAPTSVMGASKRMAEWIVRDAARQSRRAFVVVRFGNVLGTRGSVVPTFKQQIERGGPLTLTHPDMKRFFMTVSEAVHLVLQAGGMGCGGELFVLNMGEPVAIADLAKDLVRLSGLSPTDVPIVYSGLRPGEKLQEALWEDGAVVKPTGNPDLLTVSEAEPMLEGAQLREALNALHVAVDRHDDLEIRAVLAEYVSTYKPPFSLLTTGGRSNHLRLLDER